MPFNWAAKYQSQRRQYWPEVEQFFAELPPYLFRQAVLLKNNLATFYADTGQFRDILSHPHDPPFLYLHFWLLDDLGLVDQAQKTSLEKHLFLAMLFTFAAVYVQESILDDGSNFDQQYLFLAQALLQEAERHLAQIHPPTSPFWAYYRAYWQEYAEATLAGRCSLPFQPAPGNETELDISLETTAGRLVFTKISAAAAAIGAGRGEAIVTQLRPLLDQLNLIWQTLRDIAAIRRDITRRCYTYPLVRTMQAAGIDPNQPISGEQLLGALVLTGTVQKIGQEMLLKLKQCETAAKTLTLSSLTLYFTVLAEQIEAMMALFSLKANQTHKKLSRPFFTPYVDPLPKVIDMAERYLLADPTFKESWEVQRRGIFDVSEITGQAFPAGLIVEILCRQGHPMAGPINMVFNTLQTTGFRYYNHPHLPPDTDDLALLLRLYPYSAQPTQHQAVLQTPLRWLAQNIEEAGEIPVWLTKDEEADETTQQQVSLWGNTCITVEANLLLGLSDYDWPGYQSLIERAAGHICEQLLAKGLSATAHYIPVYSLWTLFTLIARLSARPIQPDLKDKFEAAVQKLTELFLIEANQPNLSPQTAAFLTLICLNQDIPDPINALFKPDWPTLLCKRQRYDGSWLAEPLYGTPTRGELATWYASNPVTTAFCYYALNSFARYAAES